MKSLAEEINKLIELNICVKGSGFGCACSKCLKEFEVAKKLLEDKLKGRKTNINK